MSSFDNTGTSARITRSLPRWTCRSPAPSPMAQTSCPVSTMVRWMLVR